MQKEKKYIKIDFYKLWKYIRINRQKKEALKSFLFSINPVIFSKLESYQHWKDSKVFSGNIDNSITSKVNNLQYSKNYTKINPKFAIVIHVYYLDIFREIISLLPHNNKIIFKLFISCQHKLQNEINTILKDFSFEFETISTYNQGRDILPFLKILPLVFNQKYDLILKVHTKRSNHLNKKELWSKGLFSELLVEEKLHNAIEVFSTHAEVGMVGPEGHILPMSLYYGGNAFSVEKLCLKMGLQKSQLGGMNFVAGSMFFARKEVLHPILKLNLNANDFEAEDNQLDNTMAHSIERVFAAGLIVANMKMADTSSTPESVSCRITINHPFTI